MTSRRVLIALSGASGAGYGLELIRSIKTLPDTNVHLTVIYNKTSLSILENETEATLQDIQQAADEVVANTMMEHPIASGSNPFDQMVICPCSSSTVGKVHSGISDNLSTRCASVALKEGRELILVVRETPLSTPVLKAMYELSSWGVKIMPASPPFYNLGSGSIKDLQRGFAGRVLDLMGMKNDLVPRYEPK
jgi:4-hydroxy-3-polyprenylbenzoate decarboxylase